MRVRFTHPLWPSWQVEWVRRAGNLGVDEEVYIKLRVRL
jgi:hypothetical protein